MSFLSSLETAALQEWRQKSRISLYRVEPEAWLWDVLGQRWWSKQQEIAHSFVKNEFTVVKSCNGVGKTKLVADLMTWFISVFPPEETSVLLSAPVREQIDLNMFRYFRENYQEALDRKNPLRGEITKWPKWTTDDPYPIDLIMPKRPADQNLISSFQGVHNTHVAVGLDEAGGLPEDLYTAANAVTTNDHARIIAIGNPDQIHTPFHDRFRDREKFNFWVPFSIGADDTPNFTGEMIYPDDLERDRKVKKQLVQPRWAAMMRQSSLPGIIAAKVDGEFPKESDATFFAANTIAKAYDTDITPDIFDFKYLGVDISGQGEDKSVMYLNHGGRIRFLEEWNKEDGTETEQSARRIHNKAMELGVHEVRIDRNGIGYGVYSLLLTMDAFKDGEYLLVGLNGSNATPNPNVWLNARSWHYDQLRQQMIAGEIDLDMNDAALKKDLEAQAYFLTNRAQIQIVSKKDLRLAGLHSPDHLDAAIYSAVDTSDWTQGPAAGIPVGGTVVLDPFDMEAESLEWLPIG
jgi:hypothetical protein